MAWRVALVAVLSASFGGLLAAALAIVAVDQLILEHVDQRLHATLVTLAGELDEEREEERGDREENDEERDDDREDARDDDRDERENTAMAKRSFSRQASPPAVASVSETLDDENEEIASSGIRLAVHAGGRALAGDGSLPEVEVGSCQTRGLLGARVRACSRPYGEWLLIAAQPSDGARLRWLYLLAAVAAVGLGAGSGAVLSRWLTRWAVEPLSALTRALSRSRPETSTSLALGPVSDCDEVEAIRDELVRLIARVRLLLEQAQRFVGNAAHELRTPLTMLRAELELHAEEIGGESRAVLERAGERVARLSELIERLLVLALPPENLRQGFEAVSLAELVHEVAFELPEVDRSRVRLELSSEGLVRGDAELLRSLLSNGLGNALKFAPHGDIRVLLEDRPAAPATVALTLCDSGPGIPAGRRERVFEPFYREAPNTTAGHGIGLALVGHIARAHGGSAEFLPVPAGACLLVTLPAWQEDEQA
jgi:two-component system OmpR family sensor kinase